MAEYQHFLDFKLTDPLTGNSKCLSDFGGIIINPDNNAYNKNLLPDPNHITDKDDMRDGEIYLSTTYGTRLIEITCFFSEEMGGGNLFELNKWLGKKRQQVFEWVGDDEHKEIDVIYNKGFDVDIFYTEKFYGQIDITFIAHNPYYRIKNEYPYKFSSVQLNTPYYIRPKGNTDSFPLIKITPNGTQSKIKFTWNDLNIELKNVDKEIYIDCESGMCYEIINGKKFMVFTKFKSDEYYSFPEINSENMTQFIVTEGNITELLIQPNTRII